MSEMSTLQLMNELMKKPHEEVEFVILGLMLNKDKENRIDSHKILDLYMQSIEIENEDKRKRLAESNSCILDLLLHFRKETGTNSNAIHRALHNLNDSNSFNMENLNRKFGYDKERDRNLSWYERQKEIDMDLIGK